MEQKNGVAPDYLRQQAMMKNSLPPDINVRLSADYPGLFKPDGKRGAVRREDHDHPVLC